MTRRMEKSKTESVATEEQRGEFDLLTRILDEGRLARDDVQAERARDIIAEFVQQVTEGQMVLSKDTEAMISARIAEIDRLISVQLNEIMHHEEFQKLEASWRGMWHLVYQSETGVMLKIRALNVTRKSC